MAHLSRSEIFVSEKVDDWKRLYAITLQLKKRSTVKDKDIRAFPMLYRMACADLSEARMLKLSPDVVEYLNSLVGEAHRMLHGSPPLKFSAIYQFIRYDAPFAILRNFRFMILSGILYFLPFLITFYHTVNHPEYAARMIGDETLLTYKENYEKENSDDRSYGLKSLAVSHYIRHNISIDFYCFATGVLLGLGTIYFLLFNGLFHGCIMGYLVSAGLEKNLFTFVISHAVLELTGLIFSGAAGLLMGYLIIDAGRYKRLDRIKQNKDRLLILVGICVSFTFSAALIEGSISPIPYPLWVKCSISALSFFLVFGYFICYPFILNHKKRRKRAGSSDFQKRGSSVWHLIFFLILVPLVLSGCKDEKRSAPDNQAVVTTLKVVILQEGYLKGQSGKESQKEPVNRESENTEKKNDESENENRSIFGYLKEVFTLTKFMTYGLFALVLVGIFYGIYLMTNRMDRLGITDRKKKRWIGAGNTLKTDDTFIKGDDFFSRFHALIESRKIDQALTLIYQKSLDNLIEKGVIFRKDHLTTNEIRAALTKSKALEQFFSQVSGLTEASVFGHKSVSTRRCHELIEQYKEVF